MSVAFRRESDDEHKEPTFELPIPPGPNLVTPRGGALIARKVDELEAAVTATVEETAVAALRRDLRYWHTRLATAEVVATPADGAVGIGTRVDFRLNGTARSITIVGGDEADPTSGRLAFFAPLARAMMDAGAGDWLDFKGVEDAIEIVAVHADPETAL